MAYMSVEEWRKQKEAGNTQGTTKSSATPASSSSTKSSGKSSGYMSVAEWRTEKAKKSAQGWSDAANALLKESTQYHSKWHSKDDEEYTSIYDRTSSLLAQADTWRKQYAGNEEAIAAIDSVVKALSDARSYSGRAKDFYSQWDTEDDYIKWGAYQTPEGRKERYASNQAKIEALKEERSQIDNPLIRLALHSSGAISTDEYLSGSQKLKDIDKQIAALESEMRMYERGNTDESGFYYGSKTVDDYGAYADRDDFDKVSSNRNFRNAGREALTEYDAMTDSSTWYTDANNNTYDAFGNRIDPSNTDKKGNILHPYANNSKYAVTDRLGLYLSTSEGEKLEALGTAAGMEGTWESIIKDGYDGNWELLEEDEVDIYYYLLNNSGQESADKYLDDMKTELNRRSMMQATGIYKEGFSEANALERLALSIATTPAQMISGAAGFIEDAAMTAMGKEINPYSAAHGGMNFSQTVRGEQAQAWDDATGGVALPFINFTAGDLYQAGMSAFDSWVGSKLGGVKLGSSGEMLSAYEVLMGMGAASTEAKRLYEQGASEAQIGWGGLLAGAAEMVFEHTALDSLINLEDADTIGKAVLNALKQGGVEAGEEGLTDIANTITNAIVMGSKSDWAKLVEANGGDRLAAFIDKVLEVGHSAFGGFMSGSMGGFRDSAVSYAQAQKQNAETGKYISGAKNTDALMALAQEMAKTASKGDQRNLTKQSERLGKEFLTEGGKNRATGRLYNTVRSVVTTQNISEISTALQEKGISKKDAKAIAAAVAVQANGMELTKDQQKVLDKFSKNENVQNVVNEILGNKESGINQRAISVAKFEFDTMRNNIISRMKQTAPGQENETAEDNLATEENTASYEVSEDGKTHLISNPGKEVSVKGIASIKDSKVMLLLDDGSTVDAEDVSFGSEGEAVIYATVGQMGASVKAANILIRGYKSQSDEMSAEEYAHGIADAFRYGKLGIPASELAGTAFASKLTAAQREFVYRQGKKAAGKQVSKNQAAVNQVYNEAVAAGEESSGEYHAVLEDGITALELSESQKASYKLADYIAQAAKVNIHVYVGKTGERGYYNPNTDEIWLNLNATNQSRKSMMAFALGHELVHRAKKGSPSKYQAFTEFLMKEYGKTGASVEAMIAEELAAAKQFGIKMTKEQAFEEVVCDACQRMLLDTDAGKRLAEFGTQNKQNKSFLEDLKRWISEFLDKLRSIFQDVEPDSLAAKEFARFDKNVKQILADMYVDMTIDAGDKLSTIQNAFGKGTVVEANDQGEFTMARSADGSKVVNNLTTWNNGGRETLEATLLREGYTEDEVKAALTIMDEKQKLVERIANEVNDNGKMAFPEQGRINEATLTTDLKDGHSVLSALVSNGDYPVNIDLLMVCKKRKAYQRVINRLCETGMIKQATVDALAIAEINKILGKHGFETACLGCFVESRRLRIQEWAQTIVKEWNAEVKKRNPNAKPFGFGKGEASLTPDEVMQLIGELESGGEKNDQSNLNLGQGSAVKRMGVLLDKVPTLRRTLSIEDLITPDSLTCLRKFDSNLFSMVKSRYGINSPKFVQEFNPYNHELAKYGKVPTEYDSLREYLYAIGGARMQSFSDFIIENWFDYCQIVADLAARKLPMHTYTKEIALARLFGLTGIKINMSLIPDVDRSLGKEYAGLTRNAKGELELIWADKDRFKKTGGKSYMQSINFADAIALQEDPRYSANVGTIAVGISDRHIRMMLADPRIRMIIPYHSSGMNPIFADLMGTSYYKDYTNFQNTTVKQIYNSKGQPVSLKLDKTQTGKLTGGFLFNSVLQELGDARAAAEAYKEWCADASKHTITIKGETYTAELTPKFNDFSGEENYYKLLEDFNTYDCITEEAAPQGDVQQVYPEGFEEILRAELSAQEGHRQKQEANKSFDKAMEEIEGYLKNHTKADTVHYANQHGIKLGAKDKKLSAEDKARLKQLQKEGVSFMLPKMGDKKPPTTLTEEDLRELLQKVKSREMDDGTYFPVRINTPDVLIDAIREIANKRGITDQSEIEKLTKDRPMAIQVYKARKSISTIDEWDGDGTPHELSIDDFVGIVKKMEEPEYIVYEAEEGRYVEILRYKTERGKYAYAVVELENFKGDSHMNGYGYGTYNMFVTVYQPDSYKRITNILKEEGNIVIQPQKNKGNLQLTSSIHVPSVLNKLPFAPSLPQENDGVNGDSGLQNNLPVGEDTSPRALLSNAFETIITNPIEKQKLQEYKEKVAMLNAEEQKLRELRAEIKELSFAKGKRDTKRIKELQFDAIQASNQINTLDKMLLRFEASAPLQNILQREKEMVRNRERQKTKKAIAEYRKTENERWNERKEKITERHKASRKKVIETRDKRDATEKLQKLVLDTVKWITYPPKDAVKCPDMLKQPYADFLNGIDLSSKRLAKGGDPTKIDLKLTNAMDSLATTLERISMAQDPSQETTTVLDTGYLDLPAGFIQDIRDMTENVKAMMVEGDYVVNNMTASEVRKLSQIIRTLNHAIKEVSTLYANMRFANVEALGDDSMSFMDELGEVEKTSGMKDFVEWENALPYYAFKRFGNGGESIFEGLMDAQDKLAFLAQQIFDFQEKNWTGKEAEAWSKDTHTIDLPSGGKLTLTTADAMSIYCLSRRAQGLQHLLGGGTRVMGIQKGSTKAKDSRSLLSIQDIDAINSSLTDRQRKVAEAIQKFMSSVCSEWGNEISMKRFLTREFTEKFYFPIESNDENLATKDPAAQQSDLFRLLNISATKPVDPRANNEVIIRNIFDVFTGHAADMARLNAFGLPLLDYMKWLNYRERTVNEDGQIKVRGVRKSMEAAFGNAAKSYILNLVKDVNGRPADYGVPGFYKRMLKNAKTAMVGSSLRVATLQVTSYPRAALVLSPRSLALGLSKKPNIEKAKKYCGIALWKSFGFYDTNIGRSIEEQMKGVKDVRQKMIEWSLMGAEIGDALTWGVLWNACEYEVAATKKYKVGTKEFNQAVGKKLREVVYATQVVDSTLTRSQMMRSKNAKAQELSAFMSEPTLSANILMDAGFQFAMEKRRTGNGKEAWKKTGKYVGRAFAVYAIGQLTAALLEGFWDAWRDDDEEKFGEKYIEALTENLILDLLPFNKIPIISEMAEATMSLLGIGFFSSDNLSSTGVSQTVSAIETWAEVLNGKTSATVYNALYKSVRAISSFYGVSFSGVMREAVDLWNNIAGSIDMDLKIRTYEASKSDMADELLDALIDGNEKRAAKYMEQFEDDKAVHSALKTVIKARYVDGDISKSDARNYLTNYAGIKIDEAYWIMKEWDHAKETGSSDGYSKYDKLYGAVETGENLESIINEYTGNGVKKSDMSEQISTHFKPEYIKMSESERDRFRDNLLDAYEACGIPMEDAEDKLADWDFEAENGYAYDDRKTAYLNGEITDSQLRTALIEYGGYSEDNADYQVEAYDWEAQGYGIATVAAVREYYEHCAESNVPKGTYMHIRQFSNDTDNDVVDGKTVKYSAMKKIMEEIHAQSGLTSEQKTAIAKSLGWYDKNIRKYKLW